MYNMYMNYVDIVYQVGNPPRTKEMRISMKLCTYIFLWSLSNSYTIYQYLYSKQVLKIDPMTRHKFKHRIDEFLIVI